MTTIKNRKFVGEDGEHIRYNMYQGKDKDWLEVEFVFSDGGSQCYLISEYGPDLSKCRVAANKIKFMVDEFLADLDKFEKEIKGNEDEG